MRRTAALLALLMLPALPAHAQLHEGAQDLGKFGSWEAAWFSDKGARVCYMATPPASTKSAAPVKGRDKNVLLFITHWPGEKGKNAVTVSTGYSYKADSKAVIDIAGHDYKLTTGGGASGGDPDMAWVDDDAQESALVKDIRYGKKLTVQGTSKRGTVITDTYDLGGSSDAYAAILKACGDK